GVDVLLLQEFPDRLFPEVHLVKNVFHFCNGGPIHLQVSLAHADRVLIVRHLGGGGAGVQHQNLVHCIHLVTPESAPSRICSPVRPSFCCPRHTLPCCPQTCGRWRRTGFPA